MTRQAQSIPVFLAFGVWGFQAFPGEISFKWPVGTVAAILYGWMDSFFPKGDQLQVVHRNSSLQFCADR